MPPLKNARKGWVGVRVVDGLRPVAAWERHVAVATAGGVGCQQGGRDMGCDSGSALSVATFWM